MRFVRGTLVSFVVLVLLGVAFTVVLSASIAPQTPSLPPSPSIPSPVDSGTISELSSVDLNLPPLKAVLLVGPIDGDNGSLTNREKQNMDLAAAELEANGVDVYRFYAPENDWGQIKAAAEGAHFLFYRGHGVYWSPMPTPTVGGFYLKNKFASSEQIRNDLHLAPNAIVMLYGCFTAGSSSIDNGPISSQEAQRRVAQYSDPFLDVGVAGYYADWFGSAFQMFVRYLFQGMTLGETYEAYFDFNSASVERYIHPSHPQAVLWLDKDNWGYTQYNNAFAGLPDQTLVSLFGRRTMTVRPETITYLAEPSFPARSFAVEIGVTGSDTFSWTASVSPAGASWLTVQPLSGGNGQPMTATINSQGKSLGIYDARIHVVASTPGIENGEQDVSVTLHLAEQLNATCLPAVFAGAP
jgi:hypothetical protein